MKVELSDKNTFKKLILFTLPLIGMMVVVNIYSIVDGLFVSNFVSDKAFAALNLVMPIIMIVGTIGFMVGTGGSALIARILGEGDNTKANRYFSMLLYFTIIAGVILSIIVELVLSPLLKLLDVSSETLPLCLEYGRILVGLAPLLMVQYYFQSTLTIARKQRLALIVTICAGITNMLFDFLLIYVFKLGLKGAAIATALSWFVGSLIPLCYFIFSKNKRFKFVKTKLEFKPIFRACYNGLSEMLTNISLSISNMIFNTKLLNIYGNESGVIALGVIMYVSYVFIGIYSGYSMGSSNIVAYNLGSDNKEEISNTLKKSLVIIFIFSVILTTLAESLAKPFSYIFVSQNKEQLELTTKALRIYSLAFLVCGYNIFLSAFFTGLNNGTISGIISILRSLVFQVSMILILPQIFESKDIIWYSILFSESLTLLVSLILLISNKNKYGYYIFKQKTAK